MFKSGFIGIIGRPNVGKSTLFNALIGEKLSIVTNKPQTTRNRITGIKNLADAQLIFLDTPGIHKAITPLNRAMVQTAEEAFHDVDVILMVVAAKPDIGHEDAFLIEKLSSNTAPTVFLAINKIDLLDKKLLLPLIDKFRNLYDFKEILLLSALKGDGLDDLLLTIKKYLPEGPKYFAGEDFTDVSERFIAAEFIREKIILLTKQEIPYATFVEIEAFKEDERKNLIRIAATINVEKESQKAIIIGRQGAMLKNIGTQARIKMEDFFGARIFLELFVRVKKDWTESNKMLQEFGLLKN